MNRPDVARILRAPAPGFARARLGLLLAAALAAACSSDSREPSGTADSPEPAVSASRPADRPWADAPPAEAVLEATTGEDAILTYVWDIGMDSRGHVFVVDFQEPGIVELNADLVYERTIGRQGEGPGEFRRAATLQILPGDSLLVWDSQLQRLTVFPPGGGEAVAANALGTQEGSMTTWRLPGSAGHLALSSTAYQADGSDEGETRTEVLRHVREDEGRVVDEVIFSYPADENLVLRSEGAVSVSSHPFGRRSFVSLLGDGRIVHASSDALEVGIINSSGDAEIAFSFPTTYMPVSRRDLAAAAEGMSRDLGRALREGAPYVWPSLTGLVVDDLDRVWIGIRGPDLSTLEWAAFQLDGTHELSVELPAGFEVHAIGGGRIVGVEQDELDIPRIRAYRLPS